MAVAARQRRRERASVPTQEAIYRTAVDLICERGYHGTSLRDVAKAVGVQMSSLYHHYPSKQALLVAIMERTTADLIAEVAAAVGGAVAPRERLVAAIRAHVLFHAARRQEHVVADSELRSLKPDERSAIVAMRERYEQLFRDVLDDAVASGAFVIDDVAVALAGLFAMLNGVATWYRPNGRLSLEQVADQFCAIFVNGIAARRAPLRRAAA